VNDPDEFVNLTHDPEHASVLKRLQQRTDGLAAEFADALTK
jgi:hypothetical protein